GARNGNAGGCEIAQIRLVEIPEHGCGRVPQSEGLLAPSGDPALELLGTERVIPGRSQEHERVFLSIRNDGVPKLRSDPHPASLELVTKERIGVRQGRLIAPRREDDVHALSALEWSLA